MKRQPLWVVLLVFSAFLILFSSRREDRRPSPQPVKRLGMSFSIPNSQWLAGSWNGPGVGPDWEVVLDTALDCELKVVRLSAQWSGIETEPGKYDWHEIDRAITICRQRGVSVILCAGVKSPRYPEVHLPRWYKEQAIRNGTELNMGEGGIKAPLFNFITALLTRYRNNPAVEAFQIENEPLEAFGEPKLSVPFSCLKEEVELAKRLTQKPLMVNTGAGFTAPIEFMKDQRQRMLTELLSLPVDRVGLDLYKKGFVGSGFFSLQFEANENHWALAEQFVEQIRRAGKEPVITELQAEPWEADIKKVSYTDPNGNPSLNPESYRRFFDRATTLGCGDVLLWGLEFQVACAAQGNDRWLATTAGFSHRK